MLTEILIGKHFFITPHLALSISEFLGGQQQCMVTAHGLINDYDVIMVMSVPEI